MLFAPQELNKAPPLRLRDSLGLFKKFEKIPTPPPGNDSTEAALKQFFSQSDRIRRVIVVNDMSPNMSSKKALFRMLEPGFVFITGLRGGNKTPDALKKLAETMKGKMKSVIGKDGTAVWSVGNLDDLPPSIFQRETITEQARPVTYAFLVEKLGEDVFPKPLTIYDALPKSNTIMFGSSK